MWVIPTIRRTTQTTPTIIQATPPVITLSLMGTIQATKAIVAVIILTVVGILDYLHNKHTTVSSTPAAVTMEIWEAAAGSRPSPSVTLLLLQSQSSLSVIVMMKQEVNAAKIDIVLLVSTITMARLQCLHISSIRSPMTTNMPVCPTITRQWVHLRARRSVC